MSLSPCILLVLGRQQLYFTLLLHQVICVCSGLDPFLPGIRTSLDCSLHSFFILKIDRVFFFFSPVPFVLRTPGLLIGEDNGTPLQYSCLENPMVGGAW